jgi:hypothetical protein
MIRYTYLIALVMLSTPAMAENAGGKMAVTQHEHDGHGSMDRPEMNMDLRPMLDDPVQAISATLRTMFEREGRPLLVDPVVVQGNWAIAGWRQDGHGGRALLKKAPQGWWLNVLSGDGIRDAASLEKAGLSNSDAAQLNASLRANEERMDRRAIALFGTFQGTIVLAGGEGDAGEGGHEGHAK